MIGGDQPLRFRAHGIYILREGREEGALHFDITDWIPPILDCLGRTLRASQSIVGNVVQMTRFGENFPKRSA